MEIVSGLLRALWQGGNLPDVNGGKIFSAQVFGKWKVVYQREGELGGVFDAADEAKAQAFVEKYLRGEIK